MLQKIRSLILSSFLLLLSVLFLSGCVTSTLRSVDVSRIQSIQGTVFYKGDISNPDAIVVDAAGGLMMKTGSDWMQAYGSEAETLTQKLLSQGYDPKSYDRHQRRPGEPGRNLCRQEGLQFRQRNYLLALRKP